MPAELNHGEITLMASDSMRQEQLGQGNTVTLILNCSSEEEINLYYANLSSGGKIIMPIGDQFLGAKFAMITDKFGMAGMLNFDKSQNG